MKKEAFGGENQMKQKLMDMEKNKKAFFLTGVLVIILTVLDIIKIIAVDLVGQIREMFLLPDMSVEERNMYETAIILSFVIFAITYLLQIYLGVKAIKISKNPTDSGLHIIVAIICLAFNILGFVANIGDFDFMLSLISLSSIAVMMLYVYEARGIRKTVIVSKSEEKKPEI